MAANYISKVVSLCGGINVFADSPRFDSRLSKEAVLLKNPEAIIAGEWVSVLARIGWKNWRVFPDFVATQKGNLFFVRFAVQPPQKPRLLEGAQNLCQTLDVARAPNG